MPINYPHRVDAKLYLILAIPHMKVRWFMIIIVDVNDSSVEFTYSRHLSKEPSDLAMRSSMEEGVVMLSYLHPPTIRVLDKALTILTYRSLH